MPNLGFELPAVINILLLRLVAVEGGLWFICLDRPAKHIFEDMFWPGGFHINHVFYGFAQQKINCCRGFDSSKVTTCHGVRY